jgi:hypothetical protein
MSAEELVRLAQAEMTRRREQGSFESVQKTVYQIRQRVVKKPIRESYYGHSKQRLGPAEYHS